MGMDEGHTNAIAWCNEADLVDGESSSLEEFVLSTRDAVEEQDIRDGLYLE